MTAVSGPQTAVSFGYNGLGDRLRQTVNGIQTNYALDLNNSLAQVLSDGSSTYLYGLGRVAQQNIVGWQYYLGDALGSVRQLVNPAGTIIQARSYEPFGKQLSVAGNPLTKYAFTGEWQDPTGLIFLRARYYDPDLGRFLSLDPILGKLSMPQTLNRYVYCMNNPLGFIDPTGMILETLFDIGSIIWDIGELINNLNWENIGLLLLDIGCAFVPFLPALGPGIRAAKIIDKVADKGEDFSRFFKWSDDLEFVNVAKREGLFDNTFLKNSARKVEFPNGAYFVNYGPRKMHPNFVTDLISKDLDKVENLLVWNRNQLSKGLNLYYIPPGKIGWIGKTGPMMDFPGLRGGAAQIWFPEAGGIVLVEHFPNWFIL